MQPKLLQKCRSEREFALNRKYAVELGRNKRRDAENAERRRELLFGMQSPNGTLSVTRFTLRFSAAFAPLRFSRSFSTAFVRLTLRTFEPTHVGCYGVLKEAHHHHNSQSLKLAA